MTRRERPAAFNGVAAAHKWAFCAEYLAHVVPRNNVWRSTRASSWSVYERDRCCHLYPPSPSTRTVVMSDIQHADMDDKFKLHHMDSTCAPLRRRGMLLRCFSKWSSSEAKNNFKFKMKLKSREGQSTYKHLHYISRKEKRILFWEKTSLILMRFFNAIIRCEVFQIYSRLDKWICKGQTLSCKWKYVDQRNDTELYPRSGVILDAVPVGPGDLSPQLPFPFNVSDGGN